MPALLLAHADRRVPDVLARVPQARVASFADRRSLDRALAGLKEADRLIILPCSGPQADADLAAVVTRLMRREQLAIPIAYLPEQHTPCSTIHRLSLDPGHALTGEATARPLVRDDDGVALVGGALLTGPDGGPLVGETIVDDERLHFGRVLSVAVRPSGSPPGLEARASRSGLGARLFPTAWAGGRAAQTGAESLLLTRDGAPASRARTRVTFFRHLEDWLLVE